MKHMHSVLCANKGVRLQGRGLGQVVITLSKSLAEYGRFGQSRKIELVVVAFVLQPPPP
jgi:hypothetical protein